MKWFAILLLLCCTKYHVTGQTACNVQGQPSCVCNTPTGGRIDLTSLGNQDGTPRFTKVLGEVFQRYEYSYNPCYGFSTGRRGCNSPTNMNAACQEETTFDDQYSIGLTSTERFVYFEDRNNELHYEGGDDGRFVTVELICDLTKTDPELRAFDDESFHYSFKLTTMCACPDACTSGSGGGGVAPGIIGIVMMILAPFGLVMYFVIGAIVLKFQYQKAGIEMIPNYTFWMSLPHLIKDGNIFLYHTIRGLVRRDKDTSMSNYDKL